MKFEELKELIQILDESSLTGIEVQDETHKIKLKKDQQIITEAVHPVQSYQPALQVQSQPQEPIVEIDEKESEVTGKTINAPMVGTFYKAPSPESDAYVKVGDKVSSESVVCILEAMKLFNEIQAEIAGEIVEILVEDGQMVEYGQPLFKVK